MQAFSLALMVVIEKVDIKDGKGIPQTRKAVKIWIAIRVAGVKVMFEFIVNGGSGLGLRKWDVVSDVKFSSGRWET